MNIGLVALAILIGWIGGGLVNWAADILPGVDWRALRPDVASFWRARSHYWVLSWYWRRRNRCPHCELQLGWRYPAVNLAGLLLALGAAFHWQHDLMALAIAWLYGFFLFAVVVIDFEHHRVLNVLLAPAAVIAALFSLLPVTPGWVAMLQGGVLGFGLFFLLAIIGRGALGMGDVKLAGVIGMMVGYPGVLTALIVGAILGGVAAAILLISRKATRKTAIAYAPYLALGAAYVLWNTLGA